MEESLRQVIGMERTHSVAIAQQETVSLAQILKVSLQDTSLALRQIGDSLSCSNLESKFTGHKFSIKINSRLCHVQ
jgi:hypothetical protein